MNYYILNFILLFMVLILMVKFFFHFMMMLMCLEFLVLTIMNSIFMNLYIDNMEVYYLMMMVFFVIESVLGLVLLVCMICYKGTDHMKNLNLLMW
uniref:NADH dehydrogenase subunit 4L n=2 Tax=Rhynchium TaxID=522435 RepID=A0A6M9AWS2_9HYME|nr:NADH dehydrogenase subunit 4L [Rhynchium aff. brunneum YN]YP_009859774.1 NADH dehydrogenase subunit 4L [Rhynchium aff. brunneum GX]QKK69333.1 NADH dehydrogenase subunit 4L [Rhynchium aff. brunneum YN]QKK69346.1 NADH dehydrogenase subunit 4L [Rhynchium aff. brunneum GX]